MRAIVRPVGRGDLRSAWIAAFETLGDRSVQRSHLVLDHLTRSARTMRGFPPNLRLNARTLVYGPSFRRTLDRALARNPDIVLFLDDTHREELRLERLALNRRPWEEALAPRPLVAGAPAAYFSPVPLEAACKALGRSGIRAQISSRPSPGLGNAAFFATLHRTYRRLDEAPLVVLVGIPIRSQALSLQEATRAIVALLRCLAGARAAQRARQNLRPQLPGSTPVAGRKA